jgi:uncharacterized protein (TIGR02145 family)
LKMRDKTTDWTTILFSISRKYILTVFMFWVCSIASAQVMLPAYQGVFNTKVVTVPVAPTSPIATAGNAQATVSFTAPASTGGSAITGYTVTSKPGGFTASGAASPLTLTGLSNGTSYTFTVAATNALGNSVASEASEEVTPIFPANITLSTISPYFVASVNDQDYLPYTGPTVAASLATAQAANGVNDNIALNIQGSLTTTGVTIKIRYTVITATVSLPAFSQTINVPASYTEGGIAASDITFSYSAATLAVGSGTINATLKAVGGTLNAKKLDIQTGIGNDGLGWLLAQFTYSTNNSGGTANFDFRNIAAIPDRNIADANHVMFYLPVLGADGRTWLNNNLGADYANTTKTAFNPAAQASSSTDANAYGSLFQWGRYSDGHEFINSVFTAGPIATPWTSTNFITNSTAPYDWRTPQEINLWQGVNGTNNPCPIGYRLPTETELTNQRASWSNNNSAGAIASPLKLPMAGYRLRDGSLYLPGAFGRYWSTTVSSTGPFIVDFVSSTANMIGRFQAFGFSVRCLKD